MFLKYSHFGHYLRQARQVQGLSAGELAHRIGCPQNVVEFVEMGVKRIPKGMWSRWCNELKVSFDEALGIYLALEAKGICLGEGEDNPEIYKVVRTAWKEAGRVMESRSQRT